MQAFIFCFSFPLIPFLIRRRYQKRNREVSENPWIRYAMYTLVVTLITTVIMVPLCDEGTSFWGKTDASPLFLIKYALIEFAAAMLVAALEWMYVTRRVTVRMEWQEYGQLGLVKWIRKVIVPCGIDIAAAVVVVLNVRLMFDNVLWGDECFSANTCKNGSSGILQIMYFWDSHPPLYYFWLKLFREVFGCAGPVFHLASLTPFFVGIIMAVTLLRKRFGSIPAGFFVLLTGLAAPCLQYNLEIRMYSLAFIGVACCYYCAYRILSGGKLAWFAMVFWALEAAYSHYYAMMCVGIMMFITFVAAAIRYQGKTWIKGVAAMAVFLAGYAPWMPYLFHATGNVSRSWWMTEVLSLGSSMEMLLCGPELQRIVALLLVVCLAVIFLTESSLFQAVRKEGKLEIRIHGPRLKEWSNEAYAAAVGVLTIAGTLIAAYVLCLIVGPILVQRYLYPVSAVTVLLLVIAGSRCLALLKKLGGKMQREWPEAVGKWVLVSFLAVILWIGVKNYKTYSTQVQAEKTATEETLSLIGDVPEETRLVSDHVKHLDWTVLYYYFPEREIVTGNCVECAENGGSFWYFSPNVVTQEQMDALVNKGYILSGYGEHSIAVYPFYLYYFEAGESVAR